MHLVHPHGGDGRAGVLGDHQVVQPHEGDILRHPQAQLRHVANGVGRIGVAGAKDSRGPGWAREHFLHGVGGRLGNVVDDPLEPLLPAGQTGVSQRILKSLHGAAVKLRMAVGNEKADVPVAPLGQIPHSPIGCIVIIHFHQGNGAVLGNVGIHAEIGKMLVLEQTNHLLITDLNENDAVGILAVDGVHQLAALGVGLHGCENDTVAQRLALAKDAREHVHGEEVKETEVVLTHDHVDGEAAL